MCPDIIKAFAPSIEARGHGGRSCLFHVLHPNVKWLPCLDYTFINSLFPSKSHYFIEKGNGESFYAQLEQLNEWVRQEWVEQGNRREDFEEKGPKILIILDNASYHKKQTTLALIEKKLPLIQLYFLPAYSPDFNLIELVWHSAKEYIAHRLFQSVEELKQLLDRLLNQGELIIKWRRKLKNKGNAVMAS
jgi:transposase